MPDRVLRDELLESDRWLDLPTDAARLAFVGFLLVCDDFGNFEGGQRRIFRFLHKFTQIKTEEAAVTTIDTLMACDLIRRYEVGGRELFHIPRFRPHRNYLVRKYPQSPWDDEKLIARKQGKFIRNKGLAKDQELGENIATTSLPRSSHVAVGVGVGVGVKGSLLSLPHTQDSGVRGTGKGEGADAPPVSVNNPPNKRKRAEPFILPDWVPKAQWEAWLEARAKIKKPPTEWAKRLAVRKLEELREQGHHPAAVLAESAFNNWLGFWPVKGKTYG